MQHDVLNLSQIWRRIIVTTILALSKSIFFSLILALLSLQSIIQLYLDIKSQSLLPQKQQKSYETLLEIVEKVYAIMTEDTKLSTVYNKCVEYIKEKRPEWLNNFPKNIGFGKSLNILSQELVPQGIV